MDKVSIFHSKRHANMEPQLKEISLEAKRGEMIACLGPSGSGKTTFLLSLLRQKSYEGNILLHGTELSRLRGKKLYGTVGIVFQNPAIQFVTTAVHKEVEASLKIWRSGGIETDGDAVNALLEEFNLRHYRRYSPFMLSQGQQRRLAVLAMLAGGQDILLLDEPTYGQDERTTAAVMRQMCDRAEQGTTVIFTTHDRRLACRYADRIWYFSEGRICEKTGGDIKEMILSGMEGYHEVN